MRKQLIGSLCLGGLSVIGLLLWDPSARAAGCVITLDIVPKPSGPVFADATVTISKGQSVNWVPKTGTHHLVQVNQDGSDGPDITGPNDFTAPDTPTHKFETAGDFKIRCKVHPTTMIQTITVK